MKKVLFITTREIYPVNDGRRVVLYNYCKGLVQQLNCEVRLFIVTNMEDIYGEKPEFISKTYYSSKPSFLEKIKNIIIKSALLAKWPLQVSVYYSHKTQTKLNNIIEDYKPDTIICDMARTAEYIRNVDNVKYNKILDMDDLLSKRYRRQLNNNIITENSIGAYINKLPKQLRYFTKSSFVNKFILRTEARLLEQYEIDISQNFKSIIFVSPIEAKEFNYKIKNNKSIDITIGVNYDYFSQKMINTKKDNYIVFLGNMNVAHNKDSVNYFIKYIFPTILEKEPDIVFRIVGKCTEEFKRNFEKYRNVEVTGEVDDIRKYVQDCCISVAPLLYGTGIKTKILETMAMGVPVVTNDIGNEGLGLIDHKHVLLAKNNSEMVSRVLELIKNVKLQEKLIFESDIYIKNNHEWETILNKFKYII